MQVTVVMSVYKEPIEYVLKAIESVENQTFKDFSIVIVLDNPAYKEMQSFLKQLSLKWNNITIIENSVNIGLALSLNKAIDVCVSPYIARMDADDICHPERLELEVKYLEENPDVCVVSTNRMNIDEKGNIISNATPLPENYPSIRMQMAYENIILHPSVMFRRQDVVAIGKYRNFPASQDLDLWLRIIDSGGKLGIIDKPLMKYRVSTMSITVGSPYKQWLCNKYIRKLSKERRKCNIDSYSYDKLQEYLHIKGCFNKVSAEKFKQGMTAFRSSRNELKKRRYLKALELLIKSLIAHKEMPILVFQSIRYQIYARSRVF